MSLIRVARLGRSKSWYILQPTYGGSIPKIYSVQLSQTFKKNSLNYSHDKLSQLLNMHNPVIETDTAPWASPAGVSGK